MENRIIELLDGRTIQWLAEKTGLHRNTLASYIKGVIPSLENADIIACALRSSIYDVWPGLKSFNMLPK